MTDDKEIDMDRIEAHGRAQGIMRNDPRQYAEP